MWNSCDVLALCFPQLSTRSITCMRGLGDPAMSLRRFEAVESAPAFGRFAAVDGGKGGGRSYSLTYHKSSCSTTHSCSGDFRTLCFPSQGGVVCVPPTAVCIQTTHQASRLSVKEVGERAGHMRVKLSQETAEDGPLSRRSPVPD